MPRAGLTSERVVEGAAVVADQVGFNELTLTAVAEHFGVAVPSLYKHVAGLDDLRHRLAVHATAELGAVMAATISSSSPSADLRSLAGAYRSYARAHPGRYAATVRAPRPEDDLLTAASDQVLTTVFTALRAAGVADSELVDAARAIRSALHGFVALETAGGFGLPEDVENSFVFMITALELGLVNRR